MTWWAVGAALGAVISLDCSRAVKASTASLVSKSDALLASLADEEAGHGARVCSLSPYLRVWICREKL